jgi:hypothetical protein
MKNNIQIFAGMLALGFMFLTAGCGENDPCEDVQCNNGTCIDGACDCAPGYSGSDCSVFDPCHNVTCVNGNCVNGACDCDPGYEGQNCGTTVNAKFSGAYVMTESCSVTGSATYAVAVAPKSGGPSEAHFNGLGQMAQSLVTAQVNANGTDFTIQRQAIGGGLEIFGTGNITLDGNTITLSYTIYNGTSTVETCMGSLSK